MSLVYWRRVLFVCLFHYATLVVGQRWQPRFPMISRPWLGPTPPGLPKVFTHWTGASSGNNGNNQNSKVFQRNTISDANKWPNRMIIYKVDRSLARFRPTIEQAMRRIESQTCIRFREQQNERDYVLIYNGKGCHSKVGRSGGRQLLSLGYGCHDVGSTLHELCHAIGLYHEHMRYDRDQYLNIEWENIQPTMYEQFQKVPISQYRPAAKFDYNSIMIYGSKAFSRNGRNTMTPRNRETKIIESHFKQSLARSDVININTLYGCNI